MSINEVCVYLKISNNTFRNWLKQFENVKITENTKKNELEKYINRNRETNKNFTDEEIKHIETNLFNNPKMNIKLYAKIHNKKFKKNMSLSYYYKKIKKLNITRKVARNKID